MAVPSQLEESAVWLAEVMHTPADPWKVHVGIGGVSVTVASGRHAADVLENSPGLMIRQPLRRIGHPLAWCNYHAEAAPYRDRYASLAFTGRGAAGRHVAKCAFIHAVRFRCDEGMRLAPYIAVLPLLRQAYQAMGSDPSYFMEMARSAVVLMEKQHAWRLRQDLKAAQDKARQACRSAAGEFTCRVQSACGTDSCRFAEGVFRQITVPVREGRIPRPPNHQPGTPYSPDLALAQLEKLRPFRVEV